MNLLCGAGLSTTTIYIVYQMATTSWQPPRGTRWLPQNAEGIGEEMEKRIF